MLSQALNKRNKKKRIFRNCKILNEKHLETVNKPKIFRNCKILNQEYLETVKIDPKL